MDEGVLPRAAGESLVCVTYSKRDIRHMLALASAVAEGKPRPQTRETRNDDDDTGQATGTGSGVLFPWDVCIADAGNLVPSNVASRKL